MANNASFSCVANSNAYFGMQNQSGTVQTIYVQSFDDSGQLVSGTVAWNPNDYAVSDQDGNWAVYTPIEFAVHFTVNVNF